MQLTITALGNKSTRFITEILSAISSCNCTVLELRSSNLAHTTASYLLVDGNWNHIAKLESLLDSLQKQLEIQVNTARPESNSKKVDGIPYTIEAISLDHLNVVEDIIAFLFERNICIEEINASNYQTPYTQNPIFSTKITLLIPAEVRLLLFREEFLDFCDNLNIDAMIEPTRR